MARSSSVIGFVVGAAEGGVGLASDRVPLAPPTLASSIRRCNVGELRRCGTIPEY
jgi:hypothetical protein